MQRRTAVSPRSPDPIAIASSRGNRRHHLSNTRHWSNHLVPVFGRDPRGRQHFATAKHVKGDGHTARDIVKYPDVTGSGRFNGKG